MFPVDSRSITMVVPTGLLGFEHAQSERMGKDRFAGPSNCALSAVVRERRGPALCSAEKRLSGLIDA